MALVVSVRLQKAELAAARREMMNSRLAMQEQAKTAEQHRREQRFFDLLAIYTTTLDSISLTETSTGKSVLHIGKHAFRFLVSSSYNTPLAAIKHIFEQPSEWGNYYSPGSEPQNVEAEWGSVSPTLDHYFRTICILLKELELHFADKEERRRYVKLFRTQLSRDELNLIAMNLLYAPEGKRMQPYINNTGLLKHMPSSYLRTQAEKELDSRSFGDQWASVTRYPLNNSTKNHAA